MRDINKVLVVLVEEKNLYEKFKPMVPSGADYEKDDRNMILGAIDTETMTAVGILVLSEDEDSFSIEYIYVDEDYRRIGIASEFLSTAIRYVTMEIYQRNKLLNLGCAFDSIDENIYEFFDSRGDFKIDMVGDIYSVSPEQFKNSETLKKYMKKAKKNTSFDADGGSYTDFYRKAVMIANKRINKSELLNIMPDVSQVIVDGHKAKAYLLASKLENGDISFDYLYCSRDSKAAMFDMLGNAYRIVLNNYPDSSIMINLVNDKIKIGLFFENITPEEKFYVTRWNYLPNLGKEEMKKYLVRD